MREFRILYISIYIQTRKIKVLHKFTKLCKSICKYCNRHKYCMHLQAHILQKQTWLHLVLHIAYICNLPQGKRKCHTNIHIRIHTYIHSYLYAYIKKVVFSFFLFSVTTCRQQQQQLKTNKYTAIHTFW